MLNVLGLGDHEFRMFRPLSIFIVGAFLALPGLASWLGSPELGDSSAPDVRARTLESLNEGVVTDNARSLPQNSQSQAPSDAEIRDRGEKLIENQHRDDVAIEQYERIEHQVDRTAGANPRVRWVACRSSPR